MEGTGCRTLELASQLTLEKAITVRGSDIIPIWARFLKINIAQHPRFLLLILLIFLRIHRCVPFRALRARVRMVCRRSAAIDVVLFDVGIDLPHLLEALFAGSLLVRVVEDGRDPVKGGTEVGIRGGLAGWRLFLAAT